MCTSRAGAIIAGIVCLLEAIVWLGLSITALWAYNCGHTVNREDPASLIYIVYFYNTECGNLPYVPGEPSFTLPPEVIPIGEQKRLDIHNDWPNTGNYTPGEGYPILNVPWPHKIESAERTHKFAIAYAILSSLWILGSIKLIIGAIIGSKNRCGTASNVIWKLSTLAIIVTDTVAAIMYGIDISKTTTLADLLDFLGFKKIDLPPEVPSIRQNHNYDGYTAVPSVVMTVIFSRGIILWGLNVGLFLGIRMGLRNMGIVHQDSQRSKSWQGNRFWMSPTAPSRRDSRESDIDWDWNMNPQEAQRQQQQQQRTDVPTPKKNKKNKAAREQNMSNVDVHPNNNAMHMGWDLEDRDDRDDRRDGVMPSNEIRNQLPWSYFSSREELSKPPKPNKLTQELMPPVPPPDYTLRFPQLSRFGMSRQHNNDYRSSWDGNRDTTPVTEGVPKPSHMIPQPDYNNPRPPPRMSNRRGGPNPEARRGYTNQGYTRSEDFGHQSNTEPAIPDPDYIKDSRRGQGLGNSRQKPLHMGPQLITNSPNRPNQLGRGGDQVYY